MAAALPFLAAVACSDGSTKVTRASVDSGTSNPVAVCKGPGYSGSPINQQYEHLSATVVDSAGASIAHVSAQACGTNICLNGTTDSNGDIVIDQRTAMVKPAFKYGGGRAYAKFALPLGSASTINVDIGKQATVAFDAPEMGAALVPGTTIQSRSVTLTLTADMNPVEVDPFDFDTPDLQKFRAAEVPLAPAPAAVDPSLRFEVVLALTPVGTKLCPAAKVTVPNTPGWPAGSAVEFFIHGVEVAEEWAPYSGWAKVSDGAVDAEGTQLETSDGQGLPLLSVIGIRLANPSP